MNAIQPQLEIRAPACGQRGCKGAWGIDLGGLGGGMCVCVGGSVVVLVPAGAGLDQVQILRQQCRG